MPFSKVIGHHALKMQLADMYRQNRLGHALLFLGHEGSGALPLALAFAEFILCKENASNEESDAVNEAPSLFAPLAPAAGASTVKKPVTDACGQCDSCRKAAQWIHPDVHYAYPVIPRKSGDKPISTDYIREWREFLSLYPYGNIYDWLQFIGAENKQGNITAAECSDINRKINLKSYEGRHKILILWMPEYLEKEGNKLLKLIEEPPPDTLFILVAENESQILPTIVSRCQLVKVPPLDHASLADALMKQGSIPGEQAQQVASVSEGNYREAQLLLQHAEEDWQSLLREWMNSMLKTGPIAQVNWVDEIAKMGREKQKQFLRYFIHLLEQAVRVRVQALGDKGDAIPKTELDFAERLNKIADLAQQEKLIGELERASYYVERNANAKMLFMALTIKCYHIIANKTVILNT
jgi:DNA polymerase-3 subunit delta'